MAVIIDIADAVVTTLLGATLSLPFTAERTYVPIRDLKDLTELTLSVVPVTIEGALQTRGGRYMEVYGIAIGIQQTIGKGAMTDDQIKAACDPLMTFAEQVVNLFAAQVLAGMEPTTCTQHKNEPIFSPEHLDDRRVFTSVVTLTYKRGTP